jgi:murein DD-endopeptidase MepM/ murein hydrolase activator NlpD
LIGVGNWGKKYIATATCPYKEWPTQCLPNCASVPCLGMGRGNKLPQMQHKTHRGSNKSPLPAHFYPYRGYFCTMPYRFFCITALLLAFVGQSFAQGFPAKNYPKGYFTWPVGATVALAANFGELRPNHYHMGLDCKTEKKQNMPILAAADGYIARVKIEPYGFGRAIYVGHPNGLMTLYAHLNDFYPALEEYVKKEQYRQKTWRLTLDIPPGTLPVQKGQFIAYSGNTGGSQGPHLHFEIRDPATDKVLNPGLFGFPVPDNVAPDVLRLAMYDRCLSVYEQAPRYIGLKKLNGVYTATAPVVMANTDRVSFAITAYDRYSGSTNQNGIYEAILYNNETPVVGFQLDNIGYDETRYMNAHIDYRLKNSGGPYVQHLSRLPGYPPPPYQEFTGNGVIDLEDDSVHQIKIVVKDANGNASTVRVNVQRGSLKANRPSMDTLGIYRQRHFHPGMLNVFENDKISFYLPETALYDSMHFAYKELPGGISPIFQLHHGNVPVHNYFPTRIKGPANNPYRNKMVMKRWWGAKIDYAPATPEGDWYKASFREFGYYTLLVDTIAPTITPVGFKNGMNMGKQKRLAFVIVDNTEELKNFSATLDGQQWLRCSNDKGKTFIYTFDEYCPPGQHELVISVEDCVGNKAVRSYQFVR